jgi:hypothetical protein
VGSVSDWDTMLNEARDRLREQEDDNAQLGDAMTPEPGEHFQGRWRGAGTMVTKERGLVDVYLVWSADGEPGFLYRHARLVQEVEAERPEVGDQVLVLRGEAQEFEKDGRTQTIYPYVLRRRPCADPLPGAAAELANGGPEDDDLPF